MRAAGRGGGGAAAADLGLAARHARPAAALPHGLPAAWLRGQHFQGRLPQLTEADRRLQVEHPLSQLIAALEGFHSQPMGLLPA